MVRAALAVVCIVTAFCYPGAVDACTRVVPDDDVETTAAFIQEACLPINTAAHVAVELSSAVAFTLHHCGIPGSRLVSARKADQAIWYYGGTCCLDERDAAGEWRHLACSQIGGSFLSPLIHRPPYGTTPLPPADEPLPADLVAKLKELGDDFRLFDWTIRDIRGDFDWDRAALPF